MKGATADPAVNTIRNPNSTRIKIRGNNQYFFLVIKNLYKSFNVSIYHIINKGFQCP